MFLNVILVLGSSHPAVYKLTMFIEASEKVITHLRKKVRYKPAIPVALV